MCSSTAGIFEVGGSCELMKLEKQRRGMALIIVLVLISILGLAFGLGGGGGGLSVTTGASATERNKALFVAKGALQRSLLELRNDPAWMGQGCTNFPGGTNQTYEVKVIANTTGAPLATPAGVDIAPGTSLVLATGRLGDTECKVAGLLQAAGATAPGFAALTQGRFRIEGGKVGGFSAPNGFALADLVPEPGVAQIGSLGAEVKVLTTPADPGKGTPALPSTVDGVVASDQVDGDVNTQEPGVYAVDPGSTVAGETQLTAPPTLTFGAAPNYLGGPDVYHNVGTKTILPGHYNRFETLGDSEIFLEPGDYYFKKRFEMRDNSRLHANGKVRIFLKDRVSVTDYASLNFEGDPRDCEVTLTGTGDGNGFLGWLPGHNGVVWARIKAPNATVGVSGDVYGDVQADSVRILGDADGSGSINYFTDLANPSGGGGGVGGNFVYSSTWIVQ
jgi:type II secretory pathway pseudopilin PulG